jgi:hypothetical protein
MMAAMLIAVSALVLVALVALGWWVRRLSSDMDYPEAHGPALSPEESDAIRLGASIAGSSGVLGGH